MKFSFFKTNEQAEDKPEKIAPIIHTNSKPETGSILHQLSHKLDGNDLVAAETAVNAITDQVLLSEISLSAAMSPIRILAAQRLTDQTTIREVINHAKKKDKKVYQIVNQKLQILKQGRKSHIEKQQQIKQACLDIEKLSRYDADKFFAVKLDGVSDDWALLATHAEAIERSRFEKAQQICEQLLAVYQQQQLVTQQTQHNNEQQTQLIKELLAIYDGIQQNAVDCLVLEKQLAESATQWQGLAVDHNSDATGRYQKLHDQLTAIHTAITDMQAATEVAAIAESAQILTIAQLERKGVNAWHQINNQFSPYVKTLHILHHIKLPDDLANIQHAFNHIIALGKEIRKLERKWQHQISKKRQGISIAINKKDLLFSRNLMADIEKLADKFSEPEEQQILAKLAHDNENISELKEWQDFVLLPKQQELCTKMRALIGKDIPVAQLATKIKDLQHKWRAISLKTWTDDTMWHEFKALSDQAYAPCKAYYGKVNDVRQQNLQICTDLCQKLEDLYQNTNWQTIDHKAVDKIYRESIREWHGCKPINYTALQTLKPRFDKILADIAAKQDDSYQKNAAVKQGLIEQAQKIAESESKNGPAAIKQLQQHWRLAANAGYKQEQALWTAFKTACDPIFSQQRSENHSKHLQQQDVINSAKQLCDDLAAITAEPTGDNQGKVRELQTAFKDIAADLPQPLDKRLAAKFNTTLKKYNGLLADQQNQQAQDNWQHFFTAMQQLITCEQLLLSKDTAVAQQQFSAIAIDKKFTPRIQAILQQRLSALTLWCDTGKVVQNTKTEKQARMLCIQMEMLLGQDSPATDKALRMEYQISNLAGAMQGQGNNKNLVASITQLAMDYYDLALVGSKDTIALTQRCQALLAPVIKTA